MTRVPDEHPRRSGSSAWLGAVVLLPAALILGGAGRDLALQFQPGAVRELARGRLLVASRGVVDPNFKESVVLLTKYGGKGAVGLIVNRRTRSSMSEMLPDLKDGPVTRRPVFFGGPVEAGGLALVRGGEHPDGPPVFDDVYLIATRTLLEKEIARGAGPETFRVYIGYSGWSAGQLEDETAHGLWHVFEGDAGAVFDPDPESLWQREIPRANERTASRSRPSSGRSRI